MIESKPKIPLLDLAPEFSNRLVVSNPLDCWTLFCWVLYFPKAIDHYIQYFSPQPPALPDNQPSTPQTANNKPPDKETGHLPELLGLSIVISLLCLFLISVLFWSTTFMLRYGLSNLLAGEQSSLWPLVDAIGLSFLMSFFSTFLLAIGATFLKAYGYTELVYNAFIRGNLWFSLIAFSLSGLIITYINAQEIELAILFGLLFGSSIGGFTRLWPKFDEGKPLRWIAQFLLIASGVLAISLLLAYLLNSGESTINVLLLGLLSLVITLITSSFIILRPDDWLIALVRCEDEPDEHGQWHVPHVTTIPFDRVLSELKQVLTEEWTQGLQYAQELDQYTFQSPFISRLIRGVLEKSTNADLLDRVYELHLQTPFQERILDYAPKTAKPFKRLDRKSPGLDPWKGADKKKAPKFFIKREPLKAEFNTDTPQRAAIAGLYTLERFHVDKALQYLRDQSLDKANYGVFGKELCDLIELIDKLNDEKTVDKPPLLLPERPTKTKFKEAWAAMDEFQYFVRCLWVYRHCRQIPNREEIKRIGGQHLSQILRTLGDFKKSEQTKNGWTDKQYQSTRPIEYLLWCRAKQWQKEIVDDRDFKAKDLSPFVNPFSFVEPLRDSKLLSLRGDLLEKFKKAWKPGNFQPILLYGQRQIGKTSVIYSAARDKSINVDVMVVYVNLQHLGTNATHSEMLRAIYDEIQGQYQYLPPLVFDDLVRAPYHVFQIYMRDFCALIKPKGMVVVLDEFDHIASIAQATGTQDNLLAYLWELSQSESQLGFVFVTPRTPSEIQSDYKNPFTTGLNPIRVSYIEPNNTKEILRYPTDDFLPYFHQEAIDRIATLTGGHPYLVQIIAYCVMEQFNDQIAKADRASTKEFPDPLFRNREVEFVIQGDQDFQNRSLRYFENILREVVDTDPDSITLLRRLACAAEGFTEQDLQTIALADRSRARQKLGKLVEHDVVQRNGQNSRYAIAVGLLRDKIRYVVSRVDGTNREQFLAYKPQPAQASESVRLQPPNERYILRDTDLYGQIRDRFVYGALLARCSIWQKDGPLVRVGVIGQLASDDKPVATQMINYAYEQLVKNQFTPVVGPMDPLTFWQLHFATITTEVLHPSYWSQSGFKPFQSYRSITVEVAEAMSELESVAPIVQDERLIPRPINIDEPEADLRIIHELTSTIYAADVLYFPLSFEDFSTLYGPVLTHSRNNLVTLVEDDGELHGFIIAGDASNWHEEPTEGVNLLLIKMVALLPELVTIDLQQKLVYYCCQAADKKGFTHIRFDFTGNEPSLFKNHMPIEKSPPNYVLYQRV